MDAVFRGLWLIVVKIQQRRFPGSDESGIGAFDVPISRGILYGNSALDEVKVTAPVGHDIAHLDWPAELVQMPLGFARGGREKRKPQRLGNAAGGLVEPVQVEAQ